MKRVCMVVGIVIGAVIFVLIGLLLYKRLVTDRIMDKGGMTNPDDLSDAVGLSYFWRSGSIAGIDESYSITRDPAGVRLFHAETESGERVTDREITRAEYDAVMQPVIDNGVVETADRSADAGVEYEALDADSAGFSVTFSDGRTRSIDLGQAGGEVIARLEKLLEESPAEQEE